MAIFKLLHSLIQTVGVCWVFLEKKVTSGTHEVIENNLTFFNKCIKLPNVINNVCELKITHMFNSFAASEKKN